MDHERNKRWSLLEANKMKYELGWWFPDQEKHLQGWMKTMQQKAPGQRLGYQLHKYQAAMKFVKNKRRAIDVGGHIGLWSWPMSHDFETVETFEPVFAHQECFRENVLAHKNNVQLYTHALGPKEDVAWIRTRTPDSSGDTGIEPAGEMEGAVQIQIKALDSYDFQDVDFIKVDCEGYELFVLQGAIETLKRCKPTLIVEQKPETGMEDRYKIGTTDAVEFLESLGANRRKALQGDYILSWD